MRNTTIEHRKVDGLYHRALDHDSCGIGFVADIKGRKSHRMVVSPPETCGAGSHSWCGPSKKADNAPDPSTTSSRVTATYQRDHTVDERHCTFPKAAPDLSASSTPVVPERQPWRANQHMAHPE
jgi:hypothetical protein